MYRKTKSSRPSEQPLRQGPRHLRIEDEQLRCARGHQRGLGSSWHNVQQRRHRSRIHRTGSQNASDYVHAHVMPYYHGNMQESQTWDHISKQMQFLHDVAKMPVLITETQWAWGSNYHHQSHDDVGVSQYTAYWKEYDDEGETLKANGAGWFLHDWRCEGTFDIVKDDGNPVIPNSKPRKC